MHTEIRKRMHFSLTWKSGFALFKPMANHHGRPRRPVKVAKSGTSSIAVYNAAATV
jgi:hypothetical protein